MILNAPKRQAKQSFTIWLTAKQVAKLEGIKARTGLSVSRLLRALIDQIEDVEATDGGSEGDK